MKFLSLSFLLCALLAATNTSAKDLTIEQSLLLSRAHAHANLRAHSRGLHRIPRASLSAHKRATALQEQQAAALANWNEQFHEMNAKWQAAAQAALNAGQTPPTFDEFAKENGFNMDPNADSAAPAAATQPKQAVEQPAAAAPAPTADNSSSDDEESCDATDSSDEDEGDCSADDSGDEKSSASSTSAAASTPSSTPSAPASTPSSGTSSGKMQFNGKATYYDPSVGAGSCGKTMQDSDYIIALNAAQMTANWKGNPNLNPMCGKKVVLQHNGKTVTATITDTCPGCEGANAVDMSPSLFDALATDYEKNSQESFMVDWSFA